CRDFHPATFHQLAWRTFPGCNCNRETGMPRTTLTPSHIAALRPRARAYDIRDGKLPGFGIRIMASGAKRYFIHSQTQGKRVWQIVGDADSLDVDEARSRATTMQAALRRGAQTPSSDGDVLFETVAETAFRRHERLWKAGTLKVNSSHLDNQIPPRFRGCPIAEIGHADVRRWFASLRATPDRSLPVLSVIMREAERMGLRPEGSNPCRGIRRIRRKGRERFLTEDEIRRLTISSGL
ncbi:MAG: Arm DNA-binding domain-containing protein, partial [bacterium]|nr:Arm DNA-binding domain-containing protein [bacterium]